MKPDARTFDTRGICGIVIVARHQMTDIDRFYCFREYPPDPTVDASHHRSLGLAVSAILEQDEIR
jgi:hypothetical protein